MTVNGALHAYIGLDPCETACTHIVAGQWTMLGLANVVERIDQRRDEWEAARGVQQ